MKGKEETNKKPRVTVDTNLIVSGVLFPKSIPAQLLKAFTAGMFHLVLTVQLFDEIKEVLNRSKIKTKYNIPDSKISELLDELAVAQEISLLHKHRELPVHSRDKKDDIVLRCAIMGGCDFILTGDEDLLSMNGLAELGNLKIIKVAEFLRIIGFKIS